MNKFVIANTFAVAYVVAFELTYKGGPDANRSSLLWLGLLFGALCVVTFFYAGSRHVLVSSVFSYGQLLFVASPAILIGLGQRDMRSLLRPSAALLFLSLCFVVQIALFMTSRSVPKSTSQKVEISGSFQFLALGLSMVSFVSTYIGQAFGFSIPLESLALPAITLSSLVAFTRARLGSVIVHVACLVFITALYALFQFNGFGRLVMASYLLSIGLIFSWVHSTYLPKILAMAGTVPGMIVLTLTRIASVEETQGREIGVEEGMGSVFGPFQSGAFILQQWMDNAISATFGQSLFTSIFFWIPRSVWEGKPAGFGRAIVPVTQPHLVTEKGHSDAAPYLAEFVWDFGFFGLLLIPVLVFGVVRADRWIVGRLLASHWSGTDGNLGLLTVTVAALVAMVLNYVWGGSFPYLSRTTIPALILFILYLLSRRPSRRTPQHPFVPMQRVAQSQRAHPKPGAKGELPALTDA